MLWCCCLFAIPGIAALIVFILARPQEFIPLLQRVPFLHLFTALAVVGWVIDVRLRRLQPVGAPTLPWVAGLLAWSVIGTAVTLPDQLIARTIEMAILFALYGTIAHGVQRFRTFQLVAGVTAATCMFIAVVCFHQGLSDRQCVAGTEGGTTASGIPDGRPCEINDQCRGPDAEPGFEYRCEKVGMFGTYSVEGRVRYRGELQDPNEVALTVSAGGLSLLIAFLLRKRRSASVFLYIIGIAIAAYTVVLSQSRGGLVSAMLVPGVYLARRYGARAVIAGAMLALPVLLLGGRSGDAASVSTQLRYEAWAEGLAMFRANPLFGVGARQFVEHHFLTAHNSFVLTLAELGLPGMFMFTCVITLSFKSLIVGLIEVRDIPGSQAATVWGMALLASMAGILFQSNTLSFAYHSVQWVFLGLVGAWCSAIRFHRPEFQVRLTARDLTIIAIGCIGYAVFVLPLFLRTKGAL